MRRFIDDLLTPLSPARVKALAEHLMLSEDFTYVLVERHAQRKTRDQCYKLSNKQQTDISKRLDKSVPISILGLIDNEQFFTRHERKAIIKILSLSMEEYNSNE